LYAENMDSLGPWYFVQGKMRLDNLRLWTQGRAEGLPLEARERNADTSVRE